MSPKITFKVFASQIILVGHMPRFLSFLLQINRDKLTWPLSPTTPARWHSSCPTFRPSVDSIQEGRWTQCWFQLKVAHQRWAQSVKWTCVSLPIVCVGELQVEGLPPLPHSPGVPSPSLHVDFLSCPTGSSLPSPVTWMYVRWNCQWV